MEFVSLLLSAHLKNKEVKPHSLPFDIRDATLHHLSGNPLSTEVHKHKSGEYPEHHSDLYQESRI